MERPGDGSHGTESLCLMNPGVFVVMDAAPSIFMRPAVSKSSTVHTCQSWPLSHTSSINDSGIAVFELSPSAPILASVSRTVSEEGVTIPVFCSLKLHNHDAIYRGACVFSA